MSKYHPDSAAEKQPRLIHCMECERVFLKKSHLTRHVNVTHKKQDSDTSRVGVIVDSCVEIIHIDSDDNSNPAFST
jgi:hypothetical protein